MISTRRQEDNPPEPDWLASELFPPSPRGLPRVAMTVDIELQWRSRQRQLADLRHWMAEREAADSRSGSCGRG